MADTQDINQVFVDIALSEDRVVGQGYATGFEQGLLSGNTDAYHMGYHRGAEVGAELGFYWGFLATKTTKNCAAFDSLREAIVKFPHSGSDADLAFVRGKFQRLCALLRIRSPITSIDKFAF